MKRRCSVVSHAASLALSVCVSASAFAQTGTVTVLGTANPFYPLGTPPTGTAAPHITLNSLLTSRTFTFSVTGNVDCCSNGASLYAPPDGNTGAGQSISGVGNISGITLPTRLGLIGVFLGAGGAPATAPASLDYTTGCGINCVVNDPVLGQAFFIGDGSATLPPLLPGFPAFSIQQLFNAPDNATELYLGIPDACGFNGTPNGCYDDNGGSFIVNFNEFGEDVPGPGDETTTPEPASLVLLATGLAGIGGIARRRKKLSA